MNLFTMEEFAPRRRQAQTRIEEALHPIVEEAVDLNEDTNGWNTLLDEVESQYEIAYAEDAEGTVPPLPQGWRNELLKTLRETTSPRTDRTVNNISIWLATWVLSQATIAAANADPEDLLLEWVDMGDNAVRPAHREVSGQQRPPGQPFDVSGVEMPYPGWPGAPIELWINCRCTLRPVMAEEFASAGYFFVPEFIDHFVSEKPWDGSAARFTEEQWKHSCVMHVCEGMEKSCHKLPIREPSGALSRAGVHAAAGRIGQTEGTAEQKASAKRALRGAYKELGEEPPDSLTAAGGTMEDEITEVAPEEVNTPIEDITVEWHGVLAPEDTKSGDGRKFTGGSLSMRPAPLPLTWQRVSADGHDGSVTVATIDRIVRVGNEARGQGRFIVNAEANEVMALIAEFGRYGVSVDADDVAFELDEDEEVVSFTKARIASASIVSIPAFMQAWVSLGPPPDDFFDGGEDLSSEGSEPDEALVASASFKDLAPGKTEDGPGWLTHPVDTDRLRDYWVRGPGAAKINWGAPGDFNRCRLAVAEYVKPQYLAGYCANRHYDALGFWPGQHAGESTTFNGDPDATPAPAVSLVASAAATKAPHEWFVDPEFKEKTHLTVTEEGEVYGHIATWDTCHGKFTDECVLPPRSMTNYAHFATGQVLTDKGLVNTGPITVAKQEQQRGHAPDRLRMRPAIAHYENTCAAVADVAVGEDSFGIWVHGWVRPGATEEQVAALRASDVSGDWRWAPASRSMEMIAALGVNSGGFHTPRVSAGFEDGQQVSLVAAGYLPAEPEQQRDLTSFVSEIAAQVAKEIEMRSKRKDRMAELAAALEED